MNNRWNPMLRDVDLDNFGYAPPSVCSANLGNFAQQFILQWINLKFVASTPIGFAVALSTGSPTGATPFVGEPGTASGYSRQTCTWASASGPPYSAFNMNPMTFGPFSSNCNISGIGVLDSIATPTVGQILWFGLLATARAITAGDSLIIAASALTSQVS